MIRFAPALAECEPADTGSWHSISRAGSPANLRAHFRRATSISPSQHRAAFTRDQAKSIIAIGQPSRVS